MKIQYDLLPESKRGHLPSDESSLKFGALRTDHMFLMDYSDGEWHSARIIPYSDFNIAPGAICLHYGQTIFEGAKAFRHSDGEIYLFRYDKNITRLNRSADIVCMQNFPEEYHAEAIKRLVDVERDWCPSYPESSLYIRPFMFGTSDMLGVKPSQNYTFCIMLSPSGPYYSGGFSNAIRLLITKEFHRAVKGGTGASKTGGNYVASFRAAEAAHAMGAEQVLYLDATNTQVEEAGAMNHFHVLKDGTFIIPEFSGTILRSITSESILDLAQLNKVKARQEVVKLDAFLEGIRSGEIIEAGGFGTAAAVSSVGSYVFEDGKILQIGDGKPGKYATNLYNLYSAIQTGKDSAPEGWLWQVPHF